MTPMNEQSKEFPYALLLLYYRGALRNPSALAQIEYNLNIDLRWRAHLESVQRLDYECGVARQEEKELAVFQPTPLCHQLVNGQEPKEIEQTEEEIKARRRHKQKCIFCRRLRRMQHAETVRTAAGLPKGEKLLREWMLDRYYLAAMQRLIKEMTVETPPPA